MQSLLVLVTLFVFGALSQPHSIRFLHGSVDAPAVDIYLQGTPVVLGLEYATWSKYILINANVSQNVEVKVANDYEVVYAFTIPKAEFNVSRPQTVIIHGLVKDLQWRILDQHCTPHGRGAWLNALHLYHGFENVDISINSDFLCTGKDAEANRLLWRDVEYEELTDMKLTSTPYKSAFNVTVTLTRVPHPVVWTGSFFAQEGHTYTLLVVGENVVDPFSACSSRGTKATPSCPQYPIRGPAWLVVDSQFSPTCATK